MIIRQEIVINSIVGLHVKVTADKGLDLEWLESLVFSTRHLPAGDVAANLEENIMESCKGAGDVEIIVKKTNPNDNWEIVESELYVGKM